MTSYQHLPLAVNFVSIYWRVSWGSDDIVYQYPSFENAVCSQHYGLFLHFRPVCCSRYSAHSVSNRTGRFMPSVTCHGCSNNKCTCTRKSYLLTNVKHRNGQRTPFHGIETGLQEQTLLRNKSSTSRRFRRFLEGGLRSVLPSDHHAEQTRKRLWGTRTSFLCYMVVLDQSEARPTCNQCHT